MHVMCRDDNESDQAQIVSTCKRKKSPAIHTLCVDKVFDNFCVLHIYFLFLVLDIEFSSFHTLMFVSI